MDPGSADQKHFNLKTPKGTRDFNDKEMAIRERIFTTITSVFKRHGAVTIDTPVFELREILSGKYGEDSKLIYDLVDQGGELTSLRYDLTVPFARFLAMNGQKYQNIKRYHIAKVYRRDNPSITKGRMREFYQCDFDVAGTYDPMLPDAEVLKVTVEALSALDIGSFTVKLNHRKILDGMFEVCGVPVEKFRPISSAVDKLDKAPWAEVRREMVEEKGLDPVVADRIEKYVSLSGGADVIKKLEEDTEFVGSERARKGLEEMKLLLKYLDSMGIAEKILFDLSLARGLDYYTGPIYEAVFNNPADGAGYDGELVGVGSIAAGGRYDNLVGMFSGGRQIPCVGVSLGIERIFSILLRKTKLEEVKSNEVEVYVIGLGDGVLEERIRIAAELWDAGIKAEFSYKVKPRLQSEFDTCDRDQIPFSVLVGPGEVKDGKVRVKDMTDKSEENKRGVLIDRAALVTELKLRLC
ncbi:histidyl-tRNA synthetase [Gonapodya prolifera JEL478]|uniref:Histidine--tRNA ligase, mitochondrial n=1 Tax=Gonapodya prolifera (strain JEL478) TaxID=1344416 RepID=A0A139B069_GONPJ|nr:histidyl-tRNA synthetase [Gonapodya prolifera JEL478]|eukprot:KXS22105.1 histidyl-tRNA synthetase [Gonapodya prolifera JEL478]